MFHGELKSSFLKKVSTKRKFVKEKLGSICLFYSFLCNLFMTSLSLLFYDQSVFFVVVVVVFISYLISYFSSFFFHFRMPQDIDTTSPRELTSYRDDISHLVNKLKRKEIIKKEIKTRGL